MVDTTGVRRPNRKEASSLIPSCSVSTTVDTIVLSDNQNVNVDGTLILLATSTSTFTLTPGSTAPLNVNGTIILNGSLLLNLLDEVDNGELVPIITGNDIDGEFTQVKVSGPRKCEDLSGAQQFSATGVAVLVRVDRSSCGSGLSKGALAGIIVGAVVFIAILVAIGLFIFFKFRPSAAIFSSTDKQSYIR